MEELFDETKIRKELKRLDNITGFNEDTEKNCRYCGFIKNVKKINPL